MSNLIKALKRAEADRQAARSAQPAALVEVATANTAVRRANPEAPAPIAARFGTVDAFGEVAGPDPVPALPPSGRYSGVWVMAALAATIAVAFGYWTRQQAETISVVQAPLKVASPVPAPMAGPAIIPTALGMNEVGPLQLQLDRRVGPLGNVGLPVPPRQ